MLKTLRFCALAILSIILFACQDPVLPQSPGDTTAPTPGNSGLLACSDNEALSITLSWAKASDDVTPAAELLYRLFYSASNNIATVAQAEANGTPAEDWTADSASVRATGLTSCKEFYFNVLVKDSSDNKAAYASASGSTLYIVDDFEDGDFYDYVNPEQQGGRWETFVSVGSMQGGQQAIQPQIISTSPGGGARSLYAHAIIVASDSVNVGTEDDPLWNSNGSCAVNAYTMGPVNASGLTGISFKAKFTPTATNPDDLSYSEWFRVYISGDYVEYSGFQKDAYFEITPSLTWHTYTIPFSSFGGGAYPASEVLPTLGAITFWYAIASLEPFSSTYDIYIDDVKLY
jgi:hypothetical protein